MIIQNPKTHTYARTQFVFFYCAEKSQQITDWKATKKRTKLKQK